MTKSERESRSIQIWTKVHQRLKTEVPDVVYNKRLEPMTFTEVRGSVVRLVSSASYRDWVANTFGPRILELWREEDDRITELEIIAEQRSGPPRKQDGQDQRKATAAK